MVNLDICLGSYSNFALGFFFEGGHRFLILGGFCDWFGEGWSGGGWVWGGVGKFEVEQQNNWGHNMLPWKEGSSSSKALHACKTAHRQEEEKFLSTARIFF